MKINNLRALVLVAASSLFLSSCESQATKDARGRAQVAVDRLLERHPDAWAIRNVGAQRYSETVCGNFSLGGPGEAKTMQFRQVGISGVHATEAGEPDPRVAGMCSHRDLSKLDGPTQTCQCDPYAIMFEVDRNNRVSRVIE